MVPTIINVRIKRGTFRTSLYIIILHYITLIGLVLKNGHNTTVYSDTKGTIALRNATE